MVGWRIKELRQARDMTQSELGTACGYTEKAQANYEKGVNWPGGAYLHALGGLGFDVGYVLTGTASIADPTEMQLLEAFRAASPEVKAATLRMLGGVSAVPVISSTIHGDVGNVNHGDQTFQQPVTFNVGTKKR